MEKLKIFTLALALTAGVCSCRNTASVEDNSSSEVHESMSVAGDTITENKSGFMTAQQQMMNDMHQLPMLGNVDEDFAMLMKSHHRGALSMSQYELEVGEDAELKKIAAKIVEEQTSEINKLDAIVSSFARTKKNYDPRKKDVGFAKIINDNMRMMMDMSKMDTSMATDKQFVAMMIPHHQSAVHMAEGYQKYGSDPRLIGMAKEMVVKQKKEIDAFQTWMEQNKN